MTSKQLNSDNSQKHREQWFIALNRFGLGAKLGQIDAVKGSPKAWLLNQIKQPEFNFDEKLPSSADIIVRDVQLQKSKGVKQKKILRDSFFATYNNFTNESIAHQINTNTGFEWRILNFFSNHFSVTNDNSLLAGLAPTLEREAIVPNLFGQFEDLLLSVVQHPAMLHYLDNVQSFGPNSKIGINRDKGLNENLGREILELHTMGVGGGYSQADVVALAKGITGWTLGNPKQGETAEFIFREQGHEPGSFVLLGEEVTQSGIAQGKAMLSRICSHPSTADYICTKVAKHFIADSPPTALVESLKHTWAKTNGNLASVFSALINHEASWHSNNSKFKPPQDYVISVLRAIPNNLHPTGNDTRKVMEMFGQGPFMAGSPAGYEDSEQYWNTPAAILNRVDWVYQIVSTFSGNIESLFNSFNMNFQNKQTYNLVAGADTKQNALLLYFVNPEFMRR